MSDETLLVEFTPDELDQLVSYLWIADTELTLGDELVALRDRLVELSNKRTS